MRYKKFLICFFAGAMIVALVVKPEIYSKSVHNGLILFAASVLPGMFPFFFYGKLLSACGFGNDLSALLGKPFKKAYRTSEISSYVFVMSALSGYPVGARILSDFYSEGLVSTAECKKMSTFTSIGGPIFIVGTVGAGLFCDKKIGYAVLAAHFVSALLNGLIYRKINSKTANNPTTTASADNVLSESMTSAITSVLTVGGFVALAGMAIDLLLNLKIVDFLALPFSIFGETAFQTAKPLIVSAVEVTRGMLELSAVPMSNPLKVAFITSAISFGGLSITLQSITFLSKCKIKAGFYLLSKTTQSILGFAVGLLLGLLI